MNTATPTLAERYEAWLELIPPAVRSKALTIYEFAVLRYDGWPSNALKGEPASPEEVAAFRAAYDAMLESPRHELANIPLRIVRPPRSDDAKPATRGEVRRAVARVRRDVRVVAAAVLDLREREGETG